MLVQNFMKSIPHVNAQAKSPKCEFAANVDTGLNFLTVDGVVISGAKSLVCINSQ